MSYQQFLEGKSKTFIPCGFDSADINPKLFGFQRSIVKWAMRKGRAAIWADCGLGKSPR